MQPLLMEAVRRYDEFRADRGLVGDDAFVRATGSRPTTPAEESDGELVRVLWTRLREGATVAECELAIRKDSFRARRLLAHHDAGGGEPLRRLEGLDGGGRPGAEGAIDDEAAQAPLEHLDGGAGGPLAQDDALRLALINLAANDEERREQALRILARGFVAYAVDDDSATVRVHLVVTPKTATRLTRPTANAVEAVSLPEGLKQILAEAGGGLIPPVGNRLIVVNATGELALVGYAINLIGVHPDPAAQSKLRADAGYFEFAAAPPPALGDDVVVLGRGQKATRPFRLDMDLELDLGRSLYFKGRGLDARFVGEARLRADGRGPLRATGSIRTRGGTYDAYGQFLTIERGIINFQGPIENAGLNVLALRSGLPVEAGVEITGTMLTPRVRLVSEPSVPDAEKLSWIVLGRGQEQAGGTDSALLLSAASAILGDKAGGISRQLAQSLGLDQITVTSGDIDGGGSRLSGSTVAGSTSGTRDAGLSSQIVSVGKRLSADAFLSYEQSLAGAASVVKLTYNLSRRLSVIGRAGTDNSVDLLYSISFR